VAAIHPSNQFQGKPAKFRRRKLRWLWAGLGLLGIASVAASAGALLAVSLAGQPLAQRQLTNKEQLVFGSSPIATSTKDLKFPSLTRPVNILILGVKVITSDLDDPQAEEQQEKAGYHALVNSLEGLTDTMLVLRFDPAQENLSILSVPRDTRAEIEGQGMTKLNEANYYGGPALAAKSTSELLGGIGIDRYMRINVQGVEKLIDALGGVDLYVPKDMKYQDDAQHLYINLKKGQQHLNGSQALQFLRFRQDNYGDIGRIQRQQLLMRSLKEQAFKPETITKVPQILKVIQSNIDTNLNGDELIALFGFAAQVERSNVHMLMLPGSFSSPEEFKASYWLPNYEKIATLMEQNFGLAKAEFDDGESTLPVSIVIQDGTKSEVEDQPIQTVFDALNERGYEQVTWGEALDESLDTTQVIAQSGDILSAEAVQKALGFGEVKIESTGNLDSDVTIRLGKDAIVPRPWAIEPLKR
jgi:polyisoprenyl-teichoic acid--peptidoglycan teichoic acid transferase